MLRSSEEAAATQAWTIIRDAYRKALDVPGLPDPERGTCLRQLRRCEELCDGSIFELVLGGDA
jgi:hypothetical protein